MTLLSILRCTYCHRPFESIPVDGEIPLACESCRRWRG